MINIRHLKCSRCYDVKKYHYGKDLEQTLTYCGLIELINESAVDIENIKVCPKDLIDNLYKDDLSIKE